MQEYKVEEADSGVRADVFVAAQYRRFTRSALEALFEQKLVKINDADPKPSYKVKVGDKVEVDETLLKLEPPEIDLPIIYEDGDVIVVNKPAGILSHSKGALNLEGTVASFINPRLNNKNLEGNRAGIVHRLDRATSGVMITARNAEALTKLQKQFSKRKVKKRYIAVVEGTLEPAAAIIDVPIGRNPAKPQTFRVSPAGKPAVTEYTTIKVFKKGDANYSLVELKPQTGRTHQLRVHMSYIGHPIVGDHVYGHDGQDLLLQAKSLEITLPSGERKIFTADLAESIKAFTDV